MFAARRSGEAVRTGTFRTAVSRAGRARTSMFRTGGFRAVGAALGAALGLVGTLGAASPSFASPAAPAAPVTAAEPGFGDCPALAELPEGADPAQWRCEVQVATGSLGLGRAQMLIDRPMVVTHAEGRTAGEFRQVFGGLRAHPLSVPGTPLTVTPEYGGSFDFHSNAERVGELAMTFRLSGPLLPRGCSIGTPDAPVELVLQAVGEGQPGELPDLEDGRFTAPATSGCGALAPLLDRKLGLPSPAGKNSIRLESTRAMRSYTELP